MKYDISKPCPHCGGDPMIANPTLICCHIHFPECVNKNLKPSQVSQTTNHGRQLGYELGSLQRTYDTLYLNQATPRKMAQLRKLVSKVHKLLDKMT